MENLQNNIELELNQEDDGKTFAGGALFGDDIETEDAEIAVEEVVEEKLPDADPAEPVVVEEKPVENKQKQEKTKKTEPKKIEEAKEQPLDEEVPLFSSSNLFKFGLGELKKGYSVVKRKDAEEWLKHRKVRLATARELARYYGKDE